MEEESEETAGNVLEPDAGDENINLSNEIQQSENIIEVEGKIESEHCIDNVSESYVPDSDNIKVDETDEGELVEDKSGNLLDVHEIEQTDVTELEQENVKEEQNPTQDEVVEEEAYVEEPPPDPTAPYDLSDSKEALKEPFELRPDQVAEIEQLWDFFQNYTPVYTDIDQYITEKELVYMLKSLLLMTYTPEQLQELIEFCVRPPHPHGYITYEQFMMIVKIRQRDLPVEEELRSALQVLDPDRTGTVDKEKLNELLATKGHKMPQKQLDKLIKEVDMSNDGTIGIEDVVGTMCIDLNKEDIQMLRDSLNPRKEEITTDEAF